jgi:type I restriction enzyme S subunit
MDSKPLVPKLRFPEFRYSQEWIEHALSEVTIESTARNGNRLSLSSVMGVNKVDGIVPMEKRLIASDISRYKLVREDWFAYNPMRLNIGSIARWTGKSDIVVSPDYIVFRCLGKAGTGIYPAFLDHLRRSDYWRQFVTEGGDGSVRVRIYYKDLARLRLPLPSLPEQHKIADCLTSLDELIAAEGRKLEALQAHKKGLMQNLFPREGETTPRLRFPEFRDAGEWEEKKLGEVAENLDNRRVPITSSDREAGDVPYYGASGVVDYVNGFIFDEDLLCVSEDGANLVARAYPIAFSISGKTWVNNHAHVLRFESACTQKFVEVYLNSIKLDDFLTGMAQPKLNKAMLDSIPIPSPDILEQERVADCVSSLDTLITAQEKKVDTLKLHKQGLMQGLFPSQPQSEASGC